MTRHGSLGGRLWARLSARLSARLWEAGLGPGGVRALALIGVLSVVRAVALVLIAGSLADSIVAVSAGTQGWRGALVLGAIGAVLRAGTGWAIGTVAAREAVSAKTRIRADLAGRIAEGGVDSGSAAVLATTGVDDLDDYYGSVIPATVSAFVVPVVLGARILSLDWLSALVIGVTIPLVPLFMVLIGMHTRERTDAASRALQRLTDHLVELAHGLPVLVGLGRVEEQTEALAGIQSELRRRTSLTLRTAFLSALALELIATLSVAVVAVLLGIRLLAGQVELGTALVVLLLAPECFAAVREVGTAFHASQNGTSALRRVRELLAAVPRVIRSLPGRDVVVDQLSVRYAERSAAAFRPLSAVFERGRMTAVVGTSGAGKSTLLVAIAGLLPEDAEVAGVVRGVDPSRIAYAAQAPRFFEGLVRAELELVPSEPGGVDRVLAELDLGGSASRRPSELSPGEARRLAVARAVLRARSGATAVLLDEPTAHLDDDNAERVREVLRGLTGATVIVVTHDPRLIAAAQQVVVIEGSGDGGGGAAARAASPSTTGAYLATPRESSVDRTGAPVSSPAPRTDNPVPSGSTLRALLRASAGRWVLAVLLGTAATGLGLSLTAVSAWLILRAAEHPAIMYLLVAIVAVRFFGLGRSVARYAERLVTHDAVLTASDSLRLRIWRGIAARGAGSRRLQEGGVAVDYLVTSLDQVRELVPRVVTPLAVGALSVVGIVTTVAVVDPGVAPLVAGVLVLAAVAVPLLVRRLDAAASAGRIPATAALGERMAALASAAPELRGNGLAPLAVARAVAAAEHLAALDRRAARSAGAGTALLSAATAGLAVLLPAAALATGRPSAEAVAVVSLLAFASFEPLSDVLRAAQRAPALTAVLARLRPFLDADEPSDAGESIALPVFQVDLESLAARWPSEPRAVFSELDARLEPARWLVVDGPSGSGKTTLLTLLLGGLAPAAGRILVDGTPLAFLRPSEWRRQVAWCPQEAHVFDSTIRGNLLLARDRRDPVTDAEMHAVLRRVGLQPLLDRMPAGLDSRVGISGGSLSGGERQRLAVARALLSRAGLLLLDEPTAHLDAATAAAMMADIRSATHDRMVVLVTHRAEDRAAGDRLIRLGGRTFDPAAIPPTAGIVTV